MADDQEEGMKNFLDRIGNSIESIGESEDEPEVTSVKKKEEE